MRLVLHPDNLVDYATFLKIKNLPQYAFQGRTAIVPDEYAHLLSRKAAQAVDIDFKPSPFLFDYQIGITAMALRKRRMAIFADCGLGKTLMYAEYIRHVLDALPTGKCALWISPLMVVNQTMDELRRWYGPDMLGAEKVASGDCGEWLAHGKGRLGLTNFEALTNPVEPGRLGALIVDESSMLKSHYGKWGQAILRLGRGLEWILAGTGTPAPNDRIEYANHAVLMGAFPNINAFLARFFVNKGQTQERWMLKPHAVASFYKALSHWSIFLSNPATYGWHDHATDIPPVHVHVHDVPTTSAQLDAIREVTGQLITTHIGGIGTRSSLGQIAKGRYNGEAVETLKPAYIRKLVDSWPTESTIIWCLYNAEQERIAKTFPEAANIDGMTPYDERERLIADMKAGRRRILITKPKILGYGLNLQVCTRQVFSGLQDSYESFYQAVKRSNRVGSTRPLNVHIPVIESERPMIQTVLEKAHRVQQDTEEQERLFREHAI